MYAQLLSLLLFACQIILNGSSVIREKRYSVLAGSETSTNTRLATLPDGYVSFPDVHAAYKFHKIDTTWDEARDRCVAEGAHLAITDSIAKIEHINSLKTVPFKWIHVGFYRSKATNQWVRVDNGIPVTSIPWKKDNPDGTGNCVGIALFADALIDYSCDWPGYNFVCEIPIR